MENLIEKISYFVNTSKGKDLENELNNSFRFEKHYYAILLDDLYLMMLKNQDDTDFFHVAFSKKDFFLNKDDLDRILNHEYFRTVFPEGLLVIEKSKLLAIKFLYKILTEVDDYTIRESKKDISFEDSAPLSETNYISLYERINYLIGDSNAFPIMRDIISKNRNDIKNKSLEIVRKTSFIDKNSPDCSEKIPKIIENSKELINEEINILYFVKYFSTVIIDDRNTSV